MAFAAERRTEAILSDVLTVSQCAEMLGLTNRRVRVFIATGRLPAFRLASLYLVRREDLLEFAQHPRRPGRPALAE